MGMGTTVASVLALYSPSILFGMLFLLSYRREPRQFRNAIWLLLFLLTFLTTTLLHFGESWALLPLVLTVVFGPLIAVVFLLANTVVVVRHEGLSLATLLPALLAVAIVGWFVCYPLMLVMKAPKWLISVASLITLEGVWFFFSFAALLVYSTLYRLLPRKRWYDYIIIHGAGLMPDGTPTPLLRGRIDKAVALWNRQGRSGVFIASGGQGADEVVSEAASMRRYLRERCGVPAESILMEDRSTTTMENLRFSQELMTSLRGPQIVGHRREPAYRCALVTSDYHVFRASEYAHTIGLKADGIGSHTRGYYWPTAFIREFIAVTRAHLWPYIVLAALWLLPNAVYVIVALLRVLLVH